jgi:enolase
MRHDIPTAAKVSRTVTQNKRGANLHEGWVIANHILVSFHVAFISSVLALSSGDIHKTEVLRFIFASPETIVSALFLYISFHTAIALHEIGHCLKAAKLSALNEPALSQITPQLKTTGAARFFFYLQMFLLAPYGKATGIKREGLNYYPDAPYNLAVAAAGPAMSRSVARITLPIALVLLTIGLFFDWMFFIQLSRPILGIGVVTLLDFLLADPGKYREFQKRERQASEKSATVEKTSGWYDQAPSVRQRMLNGRIQEIIHPSLGPVTAPWQFRNCGMGGRHTEVEYPESNISMQEAMFLILGAVDYLEGQEMTTRLQTRLKEIIEKEEGCRVMGIGLEGGLAPYIEKGQYPLPEVRLWAMMKQTIEECGYRPGVEVAIALDPAMTELEIAYREEFNVPDAVGQYLFWRDKTKLVLDRDAVLDLYIQAMQQFEIPILSIEDGFSEHDDEGWKNMLAAIGDRVFVIGDDLVTTNDATIERAAKKGLINTALIKANQIGTLYETLLAMLVALGRNQELVISHRSKSPNDDMEAHIALAANSLGLKAGGGSNTERLVKYQAVAELMGKGAETGGMQSLQEGETATVRRLYSYEEPTNAGIPTVGVTAEFLLEQANVALRFRGSTPLGTSAGSGEAIHLVDSQIEASEFREIFNRHAALFNQQEPGVFSFKKDIAAQRIKETEDAALQTMYTRAQRYNGKGCLTAAENVQETIAPAFEGKSAAGMSLRMVDRTLLCLEEKVAIRREKLDANAALEDRIQVMQRKQNIGMNAMLSVSLALGRGVAHIHGMDLYELLREEMLSIVAKVAKAHDVPIAGSRFVDYVVALRQVTATLDKKGQDLHEVLRRQTGIYDRIDTEEEASGAAPAVTASTPVPMPVPPIPVVPAVTAPEETPALVAPSPLAKDYPLPAGFTEDEMQKLEVVNRALFHAFAEDGGIDVRKDALRLFMTTRTTLVWQIGRFGLINNWVFRSTDGLIVPYYVGDTMLLHQVRAGRTEILGQYRVPHGRIHTKELLERIGGFHGDVLDLEMDLFYFDLEKAEPIRIARIRDMATQLKVINESTNRNESVYTLRVLVARLASFSFKSFLGAKNLLPEVRNLISELVAFVNSPLARRVPLAVRILVRNTSSLVVKPKLIDRLWNDTIDLSEVHVQGSKIINELRRSCHHAMGKRTLQLAQAYWEFLESGEVTRLAEMGYPDVSSADQKARGDDAVREKINRVVLDLEELLGTAGIIGGIRDWQNEYEAALLRCDFGTSTLEETEEIVVKGIHGANRWAYQHHLRILKKKGEDFAEFSNVADDFDGNVRALLDLDPNASGFDATAVEKRVAQCVDAFVRKIQAAYRDRIFSLIETVIDAHEEKDYYNNFERLRELRQEVAEAVSAGGFREQRYYLYLLDNLLEEMGYLTLSHVSTDYQENGVQFEQCIDIIRMSITNLAYDGLYSRELVDLGDMLGTGNRTYADTKNILDYIQRSYHKILQRVTAPFEMMRERLDLDDNELRKVLANIQRYMHDLNITVAFCDEARSYIRDHVPDNSERVYPDLTVAPPADTAFDIMHLSHYEEIRRRVTTDNGGLSLREMYGGKGVGLLYIAGLTEPTEDGFILPTCLPRSGLHRSDPQRLEEEILKHLAILEKDVAAHRTRPRRLGDPERPLLLAIRGGSVFSMPGMLATIVFLGINDEIAEGLAKHDPWHAYDSYRRFLASYAWAVWGLDIEECGIVDEMKHRYGVQYKNDLPWEGMKEVAEASKAFIREQGFGEQLDEILSDPKKQLINATLAVLGSWDRESVKRYRELRGLCDDWNTAVVVQKMSSGNRKNEAVEEGMDETLASLTGVIPRTQFQDQGERTFVGEIKFSAAGDDLVSGVTSSDSFQTVDKLKTLMPVLDRRLTHAVAKLRRFMGTDQEIEFTVEEGVLSILQSRSAEIGTEQERIAFAEVGEEATRGIGTRGGGFRGIVAFDEADWEELTGSNLRGRNDVDGVLLVMENPTPEDIPLIITMDGLLAASGGSSSHAAVAINSIEDKSYSAVMSANGLRVDAKNHEAVIVNDYGQILHRIRKGDVLSIHGTTGSVYMGSWPLVLTPVKEDNGSTRIRPGEGEG